MNVLKTGMKLTTDVIKPSELAEAFKIKPEQATELINDIGKKLNPILERMPQKDEVTFVVGNVAECIKTEDKLPDIPAIIIRYFKKLYDDGNKPVAISCDYILKPLNRTFEDVKKSVDAQMKRVSSGLEYCMKSFNNME